MVVTCIQDRLLLPDIQVSGRIRASYSMPRSMDILAFQVLMAGWLGGRNITMYSSSAIKQEYNRGRRATALITVGM